MTTRHTPAPPGVETGPLPARSEVGLALQFWLQWIWLLPRVVYDVLDNGGDPDEGTAEPGPSKLVLTSARYRLERRGTPQDWSDFADRAIARGIERGLRIADERRDWNDSGKYRYQWKDTAAHTFVRKRYYRGIGLAGVAALAARRGWEVDWERSRDGDVAHLVLRREQG
ncbi:hypothetical protein AB0K51_08640 [Kitasatospora sp. NPDC049285]|uniref:hypothetical protein n=1 Tax=Kitasatospora sp. NPDC049285 TaxID=3157096 RepID=UPI00343B610C